ncbi:Gfo/Idh/MocA family oxidoreductase, partial [Patescibacteria group bacterium]|nr:Gfo/Idh/MocA family oxidoreductase [Patescibacteria group bacterium]
GKRHKQNLELLGHEVISSFGKADGFLICNPTSKHLETALQLIKFDLPIFIEKPLSHNLDGVDKLKGKILVGYCLRFDESLRKFKKSIPEKGVESVKIVCQTWLPDWHPQTDYSQSYSAKKELGGGVLLDLSHEIDYTLWFFGPVKKVSAKLQMAPELIIETEAIADLELEFVSGIKAEIHLSYASHQPARFCEIKTSDQTLRWDFQPNNEMYVEEIKHFVRIIEGKEQSLVTIADGTKVLEVIEAAKNSDKSSKIVLV